MFCWDFDVLFIKKILDKNNSNEFFDLVEMQDILFFFNFLSLSIKFLFFPVITMSKVLSYGFSFFFHLFFHSFTIY